MPRVPIPTLQLTHPSYTTFSFVYLECAEGMVNTYTAVAKRRV